MAICRDCTFHDPIDAVWGKCKCKHIERHVVPKEQHSGAVEIINNWPTVNGDEVPCGDFA